MEEKKTATPAWVCRKRKTICIYYDKLGFSPQIIELSSDLAREHSITKLFLNGANPETPRLGLWRARNGAGRCGCLQSTSAFIS